MLLYTPIDAFLLPAEGARYLNTGIHPGGEKFTEHWDCKPSDETTELYPEPAAMSLQNTERRVSGWKCSKTALSDQEVTNILKEFTEKNREEQVNDGGSHFVNLHHKPKVSMYPSPVNILHTGRQLPRTPGPGVLPLLPSQVFEPKVAGNESFEDLFRLVTKNGIPGTDNMFPTGRQLQRTPISTSEKEAAVDSNICKEDQPLSQENGQKVEQVSADLETCRRYGKHTNGKTDPNNGEKKRSLEEQNSEPYLSETTRQQEKMEPNEGTNSDNARSLQNTGKRVSGWKCSKTSLSDQQLPHTPGPEILPLLPSQVYEPKVAGNESFEDLFRLITKNGIMDTDNVVPTGKPLQRTPIRTSPQEASVDSDIVKEDQSLTQDGGQKVEVSADSVTCRRPEKHTNNKTDPNNVETKGSLEEPNSEPHLFEVTRQQDNMERKDGADSNNSWLRVSKQRLLPMTLSLNAETGNSKPEVIAHEVQAGTQGRKEREAQIEAEERHRKTVEINCAVKSCERPVCVNRRISELPVQGLNLLRVSGVLKKMPGYECREEDLEFLVQLKIQEKAKVLKDKVNSLRKELTTVDRDTELVLAKKEKIEEDIQIMKDSIEKTVRLGRAFLCRVHDDPASVKVLSPQEVLKQLNPMTIQQMQHQDRVHLLAAQRELARRKQEATNSQQLIEDKMSLNVESCNQRMDEAKSRVQLLHEEVAALKCQVEKTQKDISYTEERLQKKRDQISCLKHSIASTQSKSASDQEKLSRRMQRLLHRKDLYLEREKILQRLKKEL
ncbi:uncharacterized protein WCC33_000700 [Rhinophrynus dorsalis]